MKTNKMRRRRHEKGIAFVMSLIFVSLFSMLAIAMFTMTGSNTQVAYNYHKSNLARGCAESGLQYVAYWVHDVEIPGTTPEIYKYAVSKNELIDILQTRQVPFTLVGNGIQIGSQGSPVVLDAASGQSFWALLEPVGDFGADGVRVTVHGRAGNFARSIQSRFTFGPREDSVFTYGVATRGPLVLSGNILLDGVNVVVESDVYIESEFHDNALSITGNSQIAGDVKITNPDAYVTLQGGKAGIGGETGQAAIDNHVQVGAPQTQFPYPNTAHFEQFVNGTTIDSSNKSQYLNSGATLNNVRIAANTNPKFDANMKINGVLFIESPNVVDFTGNCDITGIIVAEGDVTDNSGTSQLIFRGNVSSASVENLPNETQFAGLHDEKGTFIMAPGFAVSFGGSFDTLNGCIAANGVEFFGNAGGTIGGSVINYSPNAMELSGNSDLYFNRSGDYTIPKGFIAQTKLTYNPGYYTELHQ